MIRKLSFTALILATTLAFGQGGYKGSVTASITTQDGNPLPGAVVLLSADTFTRTFVSDANGHVRFVGLVPGVYELKSTFTGFQTTQWPNIVVDTGQNVQLEIIMTAAIAKETMVVMAENPIMDRTKIGTSTVLTEEEMNAVPQARDPWSVVMSVPGIQTDRVNVGGSEAGQQSNFSSKGDNGNNTSWVMDGVEFVDPAAKGASSTYLDFSSFQQMSVTTGGADASVRGPGAAINFVTKQGSNNHGGSMRLIYADEDFQSSNNDGILQEDGTPLPGNRMNETFEKSVEIGGPIVKDRLWYWAAFNQNSVENTLINGQSDRTELRNVSLKLHGDITQTTRFNIFYTEGNKIKSGRGGGVSRPLNTTWQQNGPTPIYKLEVSQLIGQSTELSVIYGKIDSQFSLAPEGDLGTNQIGNNLNTGVWDDTTFYDIATTRATTQFEAKGNTFLSSNSVGHELQYGFKYSEANVTSQTHFGLNNAVGFHYGADGEGGVTGAFTALYRDGNATTDLEYQSATVSDTISYNNWTFKVGLRYDRQSGQNTASSVAANPFTPELLPALDYAGEGSPFTWETIAPRVGATYVWGEDNQYLIRGSLAQFYENLSTAEVSFTNPAFSQNTLHLWQDTNHNTLVDADEVGAQIGGSSLINSIDPNLNPPKTDEFLAGFEWSATPKFTLAVDYTWRRRSDVMWNPLSGGITSADYRKLDPISTTDPFTGEQVQITDVYVLSEEGAAKNPSRARVLSNRPDYSEIYQGLELTATKRLSNRWMMRAGLTFSDWTRNVGENAIQNPSAYADGRNEDGGLVGIQSQGSGNRGGVFFGSARWSGNINGLYQLPWDLSIAGNLTFREGFAWPVGHVTSITDDDGFFNRTAGFSAAGSTAFTYQNFYAVRGDNLTSMDLKFTKSFHLGGQTKVDLAAEVFNVFNENTLLQVNLNADQSLAGEPREILAPRVARFSATVHF